MKLEENEINSSQIRSKKEHQKSVLLHNFPHPSIFQRHSKESSLTVKEEVFSLKEQLNKKLRLLMPLLIGERKSYCEENKKNHLFSEDFSKNSKNRVRILQKYKKISINDSMNKMMELVKNLSNEVAKNQYSSSKKGFKGNYKGIFVKKSR